MMRCSFRGNPYSMGRRSMTRHIQHCLERWQSQGRHCTHATGELWHLGLPLMTMVGLTLIGLYDCKAITLNGTPEGAEPVPALAQATQSALPSQAAVSNQYLPVTTVATVPSVAAPESTTPAGHATAPAIWTITQNQAAIWTDLLHRRAGATACATPSADSRAAAPASRPFALALQNVLTGRTATAPPLA